MAGFSTPEAGWLIANAAEVGSTANVYARDNSWNCNAALASPNYEGLWANLVCVEGSSRSQSQEVATGPRLSMTQIQASANTRPAR